jgi:hypothetical protein
MSRTNIVLIFLIWKVLQRRGYSLFFIMGHILGGLVTVTDGDHRLIAIMNLSLHNSIY